MIKQVICDRCHKEIRPGQVKRRFLYSEYRYPASMAHIAGFDPGTTTAYIDFCPDCAEDFAMFMGLIKQDESSVRFVRQKPLNEIQMEREQDGKEL